MISESALPKTLRAESRPTTALLGLSWLHFLNDGAANFLPGILPAILVSLHRGAGSASWIMATLLIGQALQPLMGWLSDRIGGKWLILLGVGGTSLGLALVGITTNMAMLLVVLFLIGISNATFHPQSLASARSLARRSHGIVMSIFLVGGELGRGLYPLVASIVVAHYSLEGLWVIAIPALISIPLVALLLPSLPPKHADAEPIAWRQHIKPIAALSLYVSLRAFLLYALVTFLPLLWHATGGSLVAGASLITVLLTVGVIGNISGGLLADRFGRRFVLVGSSLFSAVFVTLYLISSGWLLWVVLGCLGMVIFSALPVSVLVGQDIFPENRSLGSGIALGLGNSLGALLLLGFGTLVHSLGIQTALWILVPVALTCAFVSGHFISYPNHAASR
ncbi:MAG: MFS transporter [Acidiferrobacter sp.]